MAKKVVKELKLQIPAGKATPAPPVGPALGQAGVNIGEFVNQFNERTRELGGTIVPVVIRVYEDRSFDFEMKRPPAAQLILKRIGKEKGANKPGTQKIGKLIQADLEAIAQEKMPDLVVNDLEAAKKVIAGSARSMGVEVEE
ncbi:50S ribosomal protein L11 [Candidatus Parcubacteria bacterium]|nr:MAG: 50S ribosomal protein L11 [Candidatus Parcubacteria bacterium]